MGWFWDLNVMDGPVPRVLWMVTVVLLVVVLVRDQARRWVAIALPAAGVGAGIGAVAVWAMDAADVFGVPLPDGTVWWAVLAGGGVGVGVVGLWHTRAWRRMLAGALIVVAPLAAGMGINAGFGLTPTIGDVFGISTLHPVSGLPVAGTTASPGPLSQPLVTQPRPLWQTWRPPAGMPRVGRVGLLSGAYQIPSTGGFRPRDASVYLPPAALVKHAPALPFMVMMNGQPGSPTPWYVQTVLNRFAAAHHGLAPIVIVADQLGGLYQQPACSAVSVYGNVSEYINVNVPHYAHTHLNIIRNPRSWVIAGYSDGGSCAWAWGAQYPGLWGNVVVISGEQYPAQTSPVAGLRDGYRGNVALRDANRPSVFLARNHGRYVGHVAVFTAGAQDPVFSRFQRLNAQAADRAGFTTFFTEIPGATHVGNALTGGLEAAFTRLYPALGLAPPTRQR